ncbi:MAG: class I mannose-6-phosphate isomerase [Leptotrichiaceae bacterium]|nr:class I mannose-6-phosphate isomerase [Leptotrichiaceae bacterium]
MLYPLKFKKVFIEKVWGGREFETKLNMTLPENKKIGESWEISAHPNGMSVVENGFLAGKTLQEIYDEYKEKLVGEKVYREYGNTFPLLIKYLDVNDRLSIQVHPDDETAMKNHSELGKSESWYIMEASDDAVLIMGMKPGITKEEFLKKAESNDFNEMFEEKTVKKGDFIDIVPGTVHASLKGSVLFAEIQENSDITYRIYDFDRTDSKGVKRDLHIKQAAEVIDFHKKVEIVNTDFQKDETRKNLIRKKYYSIDKIKIIEKFEDISNESMIIYSVLDRTGKINTEDTSLEVKKGESVLIPPHINIILNGNFEILRTVIE